MLKCNRSNVKRLQSRAVFLEKRMNVFTNISDAVIQHHMLAQAFSKACRFGWTSQFFQQAEVGSSTSPTFAFFVVYLVFFTVFNSINVFSLPLEN